MAATKAGTARSRFVFTFAQLSHKWVHVSNRGDTMRKPKTSLHVKVDDEVRVEVERRAAAEGRTLSNMAERLIAEQLRRFNADREHRIG
jgi:hypothetical protein